MPIAVRAPIIGGVVICSVYPDSETIYGRRGNSVSLILNGTIDDWFVSEETVTLTEVQDIYNGGAGNNPTTVISGTPKQYINFNQSSPDSTATAQNGSDMALNNFDTSTCWVAH